MSGLSGMERTLQSLGTAYGDLNSASELFDTSVIDNWRDADNKRIASNTAANQTKDSQGEAFLGLGIGEYPTYKLIKGIAKKGYDLYNKKGSLDNESSDKGGDGETPDAPGDAIQMDEMPDASGFEGLDDAPTTTGPTPDPDANLAQPQELSSPPDEPDIPESNVFEAKPVEVSDDFKIPDAPQPEELEAGFGESDDFDLLPSGLGDTPQVTSLSTQSATQGGSYTATGEVSSGQQLSGDTTQQASIDLNRARSAGEDLPQAQEGLAEGQELDSLAPLREQFGLNQPKQPPTQPEGQGESSGASGETSGASGETSGASGDTVDLTTNLSSGAEDSVANTVGGLSDTVTSSLTSGAGDLLASGAGDAGAGLLGALGGGLGEAGAAVLGAIPGVAEVAAVGAAVYGVVEGLEDLFGGHKDTKPKAPPPPATFNFKGASLGQQNQIALPSSDGVVDTPASLTAF
jgi:hypothetical protein